MVYTMQGVRAGSREKMQSPCQHCDEDSAPSQCRLSNLPEAMVQGRAGTELASRPASAFHWQNEQELQGTSGRETEPQRVAQVHRTRRRDAFQHPPLTSDRDSSVGFPKEEIFRFFTENKVFCGLCLKLCKVPMRRKSKHIIHMSQRLVLRMNCFSEW